MKKSQRARLVAILAIEEAKRTDAEKAELITLQALAAQHPDASKDTDEPAAAASPTLGSVIKGAFATLGDKAKLGTDLATRTAELATANATIATRDGQLVTANATITAHAAQIATFAGFFGLTAVEVAGKDAAALSAILAQKVSASAVESLAGAGVPQTALPSVTKTEAPSAKSKTLTFAEFSKLTASEKMDFSTNGGRISD